MSSTEEEYSFDLLDNVYETGINTFDCAHLYGNGECERVFGKWLEDRGLRKEVVILTKCCHMNADRDRVTSFDISSDLHDSLARLRTNYIDLYLLHRDDLRVPVGPIVDTLNHYIGAGNLGVIGGSNWTHERIEWANLYAADQRAAALHGEQSEFQPGRTGRTAVDGMYQHQRGRRCRGRVHETRCRCLPGPVSPTGSFPAG